MHRAWHATTYYSESAVQKISLIPNQAGIRFVRRVHATECGAGGFYLWWACALKNSLATGRQTLTLLGSQKCLPLLKKLASVFAWHFFSCRLVGKDNWKMPFVSYEVNNNDMPTRLDRAWFAGQDFVKISQLLPLRRRGKTASTVGKRWRNF